MLFTGEYVDSGADSLKVNGVIVNPYLIVRVPIAATTTSQSVFIADAAYKVVSVQEVHGTASTSGTLMVEGCSGTTAPGSGTAMLTGTVSLAGAANTVLSGTLKTDTSVNLAAGDRLSLKFAGTMTNLANGVVVIKLHRI
jgi:formylmethanofuran dehydrogenase subunit C